MKGMLFISFLDLVENQYGQGVVDAVLAEVAPENGGIYTSAGDYDHTELVALVVALSKQGEVTVASLTMSFGMYHFAEFIAAYSQLLRGLTLLLRCWKKLIALSMKKLRLFIQVLDRQSLNAPKLMNIN